MSGYGSAEGLQFSDSSYGYLQKPMGMRPRQGVNGMASLLGFFVPWFIFTAVFSLQSFTAYSDPHTVRTLTGACFCIVLLLGYFAFASWKRRLHGDGDSPIFYIVTFVTALLAWLVGISMGWYNFSTNMAPYYDVTNLNNYPSVDPNVQRGQQLMDGGQIGFVEGTRLDIAHSMGFRNLDVYCVAPIVSGNATPASYDFWAVGVNCCSGHIPDYHCGEFANPQARSGLRLMREDQRDFFRLAVQQAEAAYNIQATHPMFLYWMQDPVVEISSYQEAGSKCFLMGVCSFFMFQIVAVAMATVLSR